MNARHKKFILRKLIPFILREQGRGFEMASWFMHPSEGLKTYFHQDLNKKVKVPACGTVACIGGSIEALKMKQVEYGRTYSEIGALVGLNSTQSWALFSSAIEWPKPFALRYKKAKTPLTQAKIACEVLRLVVKTEGKCLDGGQQ